MAWRADDWLKALIPGYLPIKATKEAIINPIKNLWNGLSGDASAQAISEANERNIENQNYWNEIQIQREDTAHQREIADLQAAGLNPWLSVSGTGSAAGSLQSPQVEAVDGSKIMQATTAMALLALTRMMKFL